MTNKYAIKKISEFTYEVLENNKKIATFGTQAAAAAYLVNNIYGESKKLDFKVI